MLRLGDFQFVFFLQKVEGLIIGEDVAATRFTTLGAENQISMVSKGQVHKAYPISECLPPGS